MSIIPFTPSEFPWVSVLGVCLCFGLLCASGVALPLFLWVRLLVPFVSCFGRVWWFYFSTCLPASSGLGAFICFPAFAVLLCCSRLRGTRWAFWGCMLYLAGLDASSTRSPSVLVLLVLADLDGSYSIRGYPVAVKSRLTACRKTLFTA